MGAPLNPISGICSPSVLLASCVPSASVSSPTLNYCSFISSCAFFSFLPLHFSFGRKIMYFPRKILSLWGYNCQAVCYFFGKVLLIRHIVDYCLIWRVTTLRVRSFSLTKSQKIKKTRPLKEKEKYRFWRKFFYFRCKINLQKKSWMMNHCSWVVQPHNKNIDISSTIWIFYAITDYCGFIRIIFLMLNKISLHE